MSGREDCLALDAADPLAGLREAFLLPPAPVRLDADRLGPLTRGVQRRLDAFLRVEWGAGFSEGANLAGAAAERLAPLLGAPADGICFAASPAEALDALLDAAHAAGCTALLAAPGEFPDLPARAAARGMEAALGPAPETRLAAGALLLLRQPDPATGALRDMGAIAAAARRAGARALFDLSGMVGALPVALEREGVEAAFGDARGFLSAGPGAPAWLHAAGELGQALDALPEGRPAPPSALALAALDGALGVFERVDVAALGWKARMLAGLFLAALGEPDPLPATARGAHVMLPCPDAAGLAAALAERGFAARADAPDRLRLAFSPLFLGHTDAWDAGRTVRDALAGD